MSQVCAHPGSTGRNDTGGSAGDGAPLPREGDGPGVADPEVTTIHPVPETGPADAEALAAGPGVVVPPRPSAPQPPSTNGTATSPHSIFFSLTPSSIDAGRMALSAR